jgi:hypothetical protein
LALKPGVIEWVLGDVGEPSSLVTSLSMVAESLESRIDTAAPMESAGGPIYVGCCLVALFEVEVADLTDDQANAHWPLVSVASDSLVSLVPSSLVYDPPNGAGE